jgi:trimethylamine:corrinoid methyltransferase-like protein
MDFLKLLLQAFSRDDLCRVEEAVCQILNKIGIHVMDDILRDKLEKIGYRSKGKRICVDPKSVQEFLEEERERNGRQYGLEPKISRNKPLTVGINDYIQNIHNCETDSIEPFTTQSLIKATKFLDVLYDRGVISGSPGLPSDVPAPLQPVLQYWIAATYARHGKHPMDPKYVKSFPFMREMSEVLGYPLKTLDVWVISPLTLGGNSLESVLCHADKLETVRVSNMGSIGSTLPVNLGDAFAVSVAEVIGSTILLREVLNVSLSWRSFFLPTDFRSAAMVIGSPESILLGILSGQVNAFMQGRRWYPEMAHCMMTMAKLPCAQSCAEKASGMTAGAILGQSEFVYGGSLSLDEVFSAEQLIYDLEIRDHVQRIIDFNAEACNTERCIEDVRGAIEQGSFLGLESTLNSFRNYFWDPLLFERSALNTWKLQGEPKMRKKTRNMIEELSLQHEYELEPDLQKAIDRIFNRAKTEFVS